MLLGRPFLQGRDQLSSHDGGVNVSRRA